MLKDEEQVSEQQEKLRAALQAIEDGHCACDVMRGYTCGIHAKVAAVARAIRALQGVHP